MKTRLSFALAYAAKGMPVFPLAEGTKVPTKDSHSFKDASTKAAVVRALWEPHPGANIGLATGAPSGLIIIDEDPRNGGDVSGLHLPPTLTVDSASGGHHYYFKHPGEGYRVPSSASKLGPGIDVKGDGGYAVLPPSRRRNGGQYTWVDVTVPVADLPPHLWPVLVVKDDPAAHNGAHPTPVEDGAPIPEGQRDTMLASLAGSMRRRGMGEGAIKAALLAENAARCVPPLPERDVAKIAKSVGRYPPGSTGKQQPTADSAPTPPRSLVLQALADVEAQRCEYLMDGYLALGELNALAGAGGAGKTSAAMDIAVRVAGTLGMPCGARSDVTGPAGVLYLTTENHPAKVMRPRIEATALRLTGGDTKYAWAILRRIYVQRGVVTWPDGTPTTEGLTVEPGDAETLVLPRDMAAVRDAIREQHVKLLVIDPVISFTAADVDVFHPAELRHFLDPLALLAQQEDISVLGLLHFTKAAGTAVIMRISLSRQMTDTARIVSVVLEDPRDDHAGTRWLAQTKTNLGFTPPAYSFTVQAAQHPTFADEQTAVVVWGESRAGNADKLESDLAREAEEARRQAADPFGTASLGRKPRTKDAVRYLGEKLLDLRDQGDLVVTGTELDDWREAGGFSKETWSTAREHLGVTTAPDTYHGMWQQDLAELEWLDNIPASTRGLMGNQDPIDFSPRPRTPGRKPQP
jgi:hypothetical protein